uniref:Uncharacterized protein n=1 Tax=Romanomermis culicivorax TaxID=13658 RepID=A0A915KGW0_ROMCU
MISGFNFYNNSGIHEGYCSCDDPDHRNAVGNGRPQHVKIRMWTMTTKVLTIFGILFPFLAVFLGLAVTFYVHDDVAFNITECDKVREKEQKSTVNLTMQDVKDGLLQRSSQHLFHSVLAFILFKDLRGDEEGVDTKDKDDT